MKRTLVFFSLIFLATCSFSQIKLGLRGGVTFSNIRMDEVVMDAAGNEEFSIEGSDAGVGYQFGLAGRVQLFGIFVQPELLFTSTGGDVEITDLQNGETQIAEQKFNRVDIPVLAGVKLGPARLGVGPVASMIINSSSEIKDVTGYEQKFNNATWGYQVGAGIDLGPLGLDVKYEGSLSKLGDGIDVGGQERSFDSRNNQVIVGLVYFF